MFLANRHKTVEDMGWQPWIWKGAQVSEADLTHPNKYSSRDHFSPVGHFDIVV